MLFRSGVLLIYNVVLVSGVQQSESVIPIHISTLLTNVELSLHIHDMGVLNSTPRAESWTQIQQSLGNTGRGWARRSCSLQLGPSAFQNLGCHPEDLLPEK